MNRLDKLPEDIQNKIYDKVYRDIYKECLKDMMLKMRDDNKCKKRFNEKYKKGFETFLKETTYYIAEYDIHISLLQLGNAHDYILERYKETVENNILYTKLEKDIYLTIYYERLKCFLFTNERRINSLINLNYPVHLDIRDYDDSKNVMFKGLIFKDLYELYEKLILEDDNDDDDEDYLLLAT